MAIVASEDDTEKVKKAMEDADANTDAWLGGRAAVGAWTWERGCGADKNCGGGHFHVGESTATKYTNWAPDEPSTGGGIDTCADGQKRGALEPSCCRGWCLKRGSVNVNPSHQISYFTCVSPPVTIRDTPRKSVRACAAATLPPRARPAAQSPGMKWVLM